MDNGYYDWSPLPQRPPLAWPNQARVALCILVNLERYVLTSARGDEGPSGEGNDRTKVLFPDVQAYSSLEYGNRIGVFRVMEALDRHGIRATVAMDAELAQDYPYIVRECRARQWEFAGHGLRAGTTISSHMSEDEERRYIATALQGVADAAGEPPVGWFGHEYGESVRTPRLLAEAGVRYVMDWPNDEQPFMMTTPAGDLVALPVLLELEDTYALRQRRVAIGQWEQAVTEAFDTLYADAEQAGRVMILSLHPWLIGQAHRIQSLETVLAHLCGHAGVWKATGREIADWYLKVRRQAAQQGL